MSVTPSQPQTMAEAILNRSRWRLFGLTQDDWIKYFFNGNAVVAVVVLALITVFLFREGAGFFGQNARNLRIYRMAGLEYVDFIRDQVEAHTVINRELNSIRLAELRWLMAEGKDVDQANEALAEFDRFSDAYSDAVTDVRGILSDLTEVASAIKRDAQVSQDRREEQSMLDGSGRAAEAKAIDSSLVDFPQRVEVLRSAFPQYQKANRDFATKLNAALALAPQTASPWLSAALSRVQRETRDFSNTFPHIESEMQAWHGDKPIPMWKPFTTFLTGRAWLTASFWQDWYGLMPLLVGSLLVSFIALLIAVPLGIAAAIYVSEIAGARERLFIKPYIEFISAIPSVVLGFFGIAVLGSALRSLSQVPWLGWVPGFPMSERLNSLTAGALLALMAVPTIFSLAEDALNNVPRHLKEASYALGANRFQTIARILVPASISGIISAILLGFGRVIGETMVVLLCAGNRLSIPDFTQGLGAFFQPVHTMTGIIAQEMGEVVPGSIHYRALFAVGIVLFLLALAINVVAQKIVHRYRLAMV